MFRDEDHITTEIDVMGKIVTKINTNDSGVLYILNEIYMENEL